MDDNIKKIMDKIDGEIDTAYNYWVKAPEDSNPEQYFSGKQVALEDLKTWINENIKP